MNAQSTSEEMFKSLPPHWVEPPTGWTWNGRSYDHRLGTVYYGYTVWGTRTWLAASGMDGQYISTVMNPIEGFYEVEHGT